MGEIGLVTLNDILVLRDSFLHYVTLLCSIKPTGMIYFVLNGLFGS